jgi:anti-anti-sigma factor
MSLQIKSQQTGDVAVLQVAGKIVRGEAVHFLKDAVTGLKQPRIVFLDMTEVEMVDGGGLGILVFLHRWTRDNGIQLKIVNPSSFVREVLDRTRLTCVFDISSVEDAVEILCTSFTAGPQSNRAVA